MNEKEFLILILGVSGGILNSIRLVPQLLKSLRTRQTRDISLVFLVILFLQSVLLIAYGWVKPDYIMAAMNVSPLICSVVLVMLKLKYN